MWHGQCSWQPVLAWLAACSNRKTWFRSQRSVLCFYKYWGSIFFKFHNTVYNIIICLTVHDTVTLFLAIYFQSLPTSIFGTISVIYARSQFSILAQHKDNVYSTSCFCSFCTIRHSEWLTLLIQWSINSQNRDGYSNFIPSVSQLFTLYTCVF